ncbi:hypothetical protein CsatB_007954 [Cannabis sativa]
MVVGGGLRRMVPTSYFRLHSLLLIDNIALFSFIPSTSFPRSYDQTHWTFEWCSGLE